MFLWIWSVNVNNIDALNNWTSTDCNYSLWMLLHSSRVKITFQETRCWHIDKLLIVLYSCIQSGTTISHTHTTSYYVECSRHSYISLIIHTSPNREIIIIIKSNKRTNKKKKHKDKDKYNKKYILDLIFWENILEYSATHKPTTTQLSNNQNNKHILDLFQKYFCKTYIDLTRI